MGDQAVSIARKARKLNRHPALSEVELITPMREHAMRMFKDSVDAYVQEDVELGRALKARDKALDEMNAVASRRLIEQMAQDPDQLRGYLNLMFIARHLERVGDHATNIAEDAVYAGRRSGGHSAPGISNLCLKCDSTSSPIERPMDRIGSSRKTSA
ncbi:MAG: phosphate uptake regulator PhoU [Chthoniobacterales bacterium]|nr:phosphate uptake regulator PhoU [Chthoniobacterales bacterium]